MARVCGSCTLCCKVMGVKELEKPRNVWCKHVVQGKGCDIYETRPPSCREFECLWVQRDVIPEELKPERCHALFTDMTVDGRTTGLMVHLAPGYPAAHLEQPLARYLDAIQRQGMRVAVLVHLGKVLVHTGVTGPGKWVRARKVVESQE